jgi:hypothetical protein
MFEHQNESKIERKESNFYGILTKIIKGCDLGKKKIQNYLMLVYL